MTPHGLNISASRLRATRPVGVLVWRRLIAVRPRSTAFGLSGFLLLGIALLPACSVVETPRTQRGNRVDEDLLKELVVGTSTKPDVTSLLGSPTARATFDDNRWLYISETTNVRIGRTPGVLDQSVVVLNFDEGGVLRSIDKRGQDDGKDIAISSRATPSPGSEASFMQQLLGNIGKFSTGPTGGIGGGSGGSNGLGSSGAQGL